MARQVLPIAEMKTILAGCFQVNRRFYWVDMLGTSFIAWGSFFLTERAPPLSFSELFFFATSVFAFYRATLFIHELTHRERGELPGFSMAWNLIVGVPILLPSFMYRHVHIDHHRKSTYGTNEDGEYLPFGASPLWRSILYLGQSVLIPFLVIFRFGVLTPISFLHPRFRTFVMTHCSSLAIRMDAPRLLPKSEKDLRNWRVLEMLCFTWVLTLFILFYSGWLNISTLRHIYLFLFTCYLVNSVRTLMAHRYRNQTGKDLSFDEQFQDSVTVEGPSLMMELIAPVGLRYHALHHLFPNLPYHNLGVAHRRLRSKLPADSVYHRSTELTPWSALATLWHNTRAPMIEENTSEHDSHLA